jgi:hypothetical protein
MMSPFANTSTYRLARQASGVHSGMTSAVAEQMVVNESECA